MLGNVAPKNIIKQPAYAGKGKNMEIEKTVDNTMTSEQMAMEIVKILDEKKARDIKLLSVKDKTVLTDYFVICSGTSNTQIKSLAGEVEFKMGEKGVTPLGTEGYDAGTWIAIDFAHVIVHIFNKDQREFYKLEKLWSDAEEIPLELTED